MTLFITKEQISRLNTMHTFQLSCCFVLFLCSIESLIFCVQIQPNFGVISIWNTDKKFVICTRDQKEFGGRVQWFASDGRPVGVSLMSTVYQIESIGSSKLYFVRPYKVNSGVYECRHIRNGSLVTSAKFEIKIFHSIDMSGNIEQYKIEAGNDLSMDCLAKFDSETSEAQVIWIHENNQLSMDLSRYNIKTEPDEIKYSQKTIKSTMIINKIVDSDGGFYVCQASYANAHLSDIKNIEIEVIVQCKPKFKDSPKKVIWLNKLMEDQQEFNLDIHCEAFADPPAKFDWLIGNQSILEPSGVRPYFFEITSKLHLSVLKIKLKNLSKFRFYVKELKDKLSLIGCTATNSYGNDSLTFDFEFGLPPLTPEIIYINFSKETGFIFLEINYTESDPPIDTFKLVLSKSYDILFNNSHRIEPAKNAHLYKIPFNPNIDIGFLYLFAHNPVGWSRALEMQDTTNLSTNQDEKYEWSMSNFQISVLLFIIFLLVASTAIQVIYFNFCDQSEPDNQ